jgi:membrane-bound ClpP family serine protease
VDVAWLTGALLTALVLAATVASVHAGGHAWLIPVPAWALTIFWLVLAGTGHASTAGSWVVGGGAVSVSLMGLSVAVPVLRHGAIGPATTGTDRLVGVEGVTMSELSPQGIVRVGAETWSADSLSGTIPSGSRIHVASVDGLRLRVWSELGDVPRSVGGGSEEVG